MPNCSLPRLFSYTVLYSLLKVLLSKRKRTEVTVISDAENITDCSFAGGAALDLNVVKKKPARWIMDSTWLNLVELSNLHQFSDILDQVCALESSSSSTAVVIKSIFELIVC